MQTYPGSATVYGDSVTGPTPTTVRVDGRIYVETFERLADRWGEGKWLPCLHDEEKESCELPSVDVWTDAGWTPAKRIIRHRLAHGKRILRVLTDAGMVDATDEHSLLDSQGEVISARDVEVGSELLHAPYPELVQGRERITPEKAIVLGMFCSDGARGKYFSAVPDVILNASLEARRAFWDGLYGLEGEEIHIEHKSQVALASYALLAASLGFSTSFDARVAKPDAFRLTLTERPQPRDAEAVKRVVQVQYEGWVYDLTTESHHFAAGAGRLIVHNTDSVMIRFEPGATDAGVLERCMRKGEEAAELATKQLFREPIVLE